MKIALCDDSSVDLKIVTDALLEYQEKSQYLFQYDAFSSYSEVKDKLNDYDLFILDYQMPEKDGLEFAHELYDEYKSSKTIIFITACPEIVYDTFDVNTFRFLVKPLDPGKLFKALDDYFENSTDEKLLIKSNGKKILINLRNVTFFESQGRQILCHFLYGEDVMFYSKISDLTKMLNPGCFFQVHRSFLVRFDKVKSFSNEEILMEDGLRISVSGKRYREFCEEYLKFVKRSYL